MHTLDLDPQHPPACAGIPVNQFFPRQHATAEAFAAIRICHTCPLVDACRDWAVDNFEIGVWGATTDRQRERIRARRNGDTGRIHTGLQRRTVTARQQVKALLDRYTAGQIADRLGVNVRTVERHKAAIRAAATDRQEAA